MKKLISTIIILAIFIVIAISVSKQQKLIATKDGNIKKEPIDMSREKFVDTFCSMEIKDLSYAVQVISPIGRNWFFDDIGCFIKWFESREFKDETTVWVWAKDTKEWIDGKKAWYILGDDTPMRYGFGARKNRLKGSIDFEQMRLKILRGEDLTDPKIRKKVLGL